MTYRLVSLNTGTVLVPPGVARPDAGQRTFAFRVAKQRGPCPPAPGVIQIREEKERIVLTVIRNGLARQGAGWLSEWAASLEAQGCLAAGEGPRLAEQIAESLPLELNQSFRLLHGSHIDIGAHTRLEVVSPVLREGGPATVSASEPVDAAENESGLTVTARAPANLIGFETAWYGIRPHPDRAGFAIVPLRAERNVQGKIEALTGPATNAFAFPADAAFYRLFYKADQTEFTALAVAARTQAELEERTKMLESGPASCKTLNDELCLAIPKSVGVNAYVVANLNGNEVAIPWQATVRSALQVVGGDTQAALSTLVVRKEYGGRLLPVVFDHNEHDIFGMMLTGGEAISWK